MTEESRPMKNVRGPLTPDEREYYRHVASFNAITQGDRLMVQPCRDVLALDSALRAALERAEKAEGKLLYLGFESERLDRLVKGTAKLGGHHTYPEEVADIARSIRIAFGSETTPLRDVRDIMCTGCKAVHRDDHPCHSSPPKEVLKEPEYTRPVCRGCESLASNCGTCERCIWRRENMTTRTKLP